MKDRKTNERITMDYDFIKKTFMMDERWYTSHSSDTI